MSDFAVVQVRILWWTVYRVSGAPVPWLYLRRSRAERSAQWCRDYYDPQAVEAREQWDDFKRNGWV